MSDQAQDLEILRQARLLLSEAVKRRDSAQADVDRYQRVVGALEGAPPQEQRPVVDLCFELAGRFTESHRTNGLGVVFDAQNLIDLCRRERPDDADRFKRGVYSAFAALTKRQKFKRDAGGWVLA